MSGVAPLRSVRSALAIPLVPWPATDLDLPGAGTMTDRDHRLYRSPGPPGQYQAQATGHEPAGPRHRR